MRYQPEEIKEILRMVESEHLDIRTVTMGISLFDTICSSPQDTINAISDKIYKLAKNLNSNAGEIESEFGIPIVNRRISLTPISLVSKGFGTDDLILLGQRLDNIAEEMGIDYIAGFTALVHKGFTKHEELFVRSIPEVLSKTNRICSSVNVATTKAGINFDAIRLMGFIIKEIAERSRQKDAIACARFVVFANAVEDNPFIAGAFHGVGEPECTINVGVSGPGVVLSSIKRLKQLEENIDIGKICENIKRISFKITRAGELIGREMAKRLGDDVSFGIVDLSLAPTPEEGDSVAHIIEEMGIEKVGACGSTAALAILTDAVKKGGLMASSSVGGLSGAFIPVSEDAGMVSAVNAGALSIEKLEAMTSVCSVGLDMIAIPGDTPAETISGILADEVAIGVFNAKTTALRIIPVPGKGVGEFVDYGGLLGKAPIMAVNSFSQRDFINLGGRIPAPLHSFRN